MEGHALLDPPDEATQVVGELPVAESALGLNDSTGVVRRQGCEVQIVARALTAAAAGGGDVERRRERPVADDQFGVEVNFRNLGLLLRRRAVQLFFLLGLLLLLDLLRLLLGLLLLLLLHGLLLSLLLLGLLLLLLLHGLLLLLLLGLGLGDGLLLLIVVVIAAAADQRQAGSADSRPRRGAQQRPPA